ncbi:hypothetical protein LTR85_000612 [Meristemomyces frigidus]|nr:hypothetical protein LTR85_000612 [Meristemomyces frigidus]
MRRFVEKSPNARKGDRNTFDRKYFWKIEIRKANGDEYVNENQQSKDDFETRSEFPCSHLYIDESQDIKNDSTAHIKLSKDCLNSKLQTRAKYSAYSGTPWMGGIKCPLVHLGVIEHLSGFDQKGVKYRTHPWNGVQELVPCREAAAAETATMLDRAYKKGDVAGLAEFAARFVAFLKPLVIRREKRTRWAHIKLMNVPDPKITDVHCPLSAHQTKLVNARWEGQIAEPPKEGKKATGSLFFSKLSRNRTFLDFPDLADEVLTDQMNQWVQWNHDENFKGLDFTWGQVKDEGWLQDPTTCPYRHFIGQVTAHSAKMVQLSNDLARWANADEKTGRKSVVMGHWPLSSYITHLVMHRNIPNIEFVHAGMTDNAKMEIRNAFQDSQTIEQAIGRIVRFGQERESEVLQYMNKELKLELMFFDKGERAKYLLTLGKKNEEQKKGR